jgi:hypothetical protein
VRIKHDRTVLDISVFLKKARDICFVKTRVNASDEKVGSWVDRSFIVIVNRRLSGVACWCSIVATGWRKATVPVGA